MLDATVVTSGTVAGWLDTAWAERVVFDTPSRVIDVGVTRRLFTGALRLALEARDGATGHGEPFGTSMVSQG